MNRSVARNSQWGGGILGVWGQSSVAGGTGVWGPTPSARKFCISLQKYLNFRAIVIKIIAFKAWHRNWQHNMIQLVALMGYVGGG